MKTKEKKYYIVRTYSAGVWFGNIKSLEGTVCVLTNARRIWQWDGASTLSQLAIDGTKKPEKCMFPETITDPEGVYLPQTIEVLPCSDKAVKSIKSVLVWRQK